MTSRRGGGSGNAGGDGGDVTRGWWSNGGAGPGAALRAPLQVGHPGEGVGVPGGLRPGRVPAARARPHPQLQGTAAAGAGSLLLLLLPRPASALPALQPWRGPRLLPAPPSSPPASWASASQPSKERNQNHLVNSRDTEWFELEGNLQLMQQERLPLPQVALSSLALDISKD